MIDPTLVTQEKYFTETDDGYRFLDPLVGTELEPGIPPPCLETDPIAGPGLDQLRKMSDQKRLTIQLMLTSHGCKEDFDDVLREFGDVLTNANMVGIEISWKNADRKGFDPEAPVAEYELPEWWSPFGEPATSWFKEHNKLILPCGVLHDGSTEAAAALDVLMKLWNASLEEGRDEEFHVLCNSYQVTRQYVFLAHLGYWLLQLEKANLLPEGHIKVPLILGIGHSGIERKIQRFRIPVEMHRLDKPTKWPLTEAEKIRIEVSSKVRFEARITHEQLATLIAAQENE